jgi:Ca2+-binding RTX toxin-like protein
LEGYFAAPQWTHPLIPNSNKNFNGIAFSNGVDLFMTYSNVVAAVSNACAVCDDTANTYSGASGNDIAFGWGGNDSLSGGAGDDQLLGDAGDDYLYPGTGTNLMAGGAGEDTYVLDANSGTNTIENFDLTTGAASTNYGYPLLARDRIEFSLSVSDADVRLGRDRDDLLVTVSGTSTTRVLDFFAAADFAQLDLHFVNGDVTWDGNCLDYAPGTTQRCIKNRVLTDMVKDGAAAILQTYGVDDVIHGGAGNDSIVANGGGYGNDTLYGEGGNDTIEGGMDNDWLYGGNGDDILDGGWGTNYLYGEAGDDALFASGPYGASTLNGGTGSDVYQIPDYATPGTAIEPQVGGGDNGLDIVQFTGSLTPSQLWMKEEARDGDALVNDLVIRVVGSAQNFVIKNWQASDSQLTRLMTLANENCVITRTGINGLIALNQGVDPGLLNNNRAYWSCTPTMP